MQVRFTAAKMQLFSRPENDPMAAKLKKKSKTIDEYLEALDGEQRTALASLRQTIKSAARDAEECISYGMPAFRHHGMLVGFAAASTHCSFFLMNGTTVAEHQDLLKKYDTSKGTIRFPPDKPLPATLVKKLVKLRIAENEARGKKRK